MTRMTTSDPWRGLRAHTTARIALGASGASLPTAELLRLGTAHAQARDAVHQPLQLAALQAHKALPCDVLCVIGDGLSATAVEHYAVPLLQILLPLLQAQGLGIGPVVLAEQARVALADPVAQLLQARLVLMLIGERPGLSSSDSMGAYLTWAPQADTPDAARNCVSNIRDAGLSPAAAAYKLLWLIQQAFARQLTGVALKDESSTQRLANM